MNNLDAFKKWFKKPINKLRELPNGDGGFIAVATGCYLYERYLIAYLKSNGIKVDQKARIRRLMIDFSIDKNTAECFWSIIRNGLCHAGMPLSSKRGKKISDWIFSGVFKQSISMNKSNNVLQVNAWKFVDQVIALWELNIHLFDKCTSFPLGETIPI